MISDGSDLQVQSKYEVLLGLSCPLVSSIQLELYVPTLTLYTQCILPAKTAKYINMRPRLLSREDGIHLSSLVGNLLAILDNGY